MDHIEVRPYRPEDREALLALWAEVFPNDPARNAPQKMLESKLRVQADLLLVATVDGLLVGAVMAGFDGTRGWLHHLAVADSHRRLGIGGRLVSVAEAGLAAKGCPKVNLQVRGGNAAVVAFYERVGYEVEERISMGKVLGESGR